MPHKRHEHILKTADAATSNADIQIARCQLFHKLSKHCVAGFNECTCLSRDTQRCCKGADRCLHKYQWSETCTASSQSELRVTQQGYPHRTSVLASAGNTVVTVQRRGAHPLLSVCLPLFVLSDWSWPCLPFLGPARQLWAEAWHLGLICLKVAHDVALSGLVLATIVPDIRLCKRLLALKHCASPMKVQESLQGCTNNPERRVGGVPCMRQRRNASLLTP